MRNKFDLRINKEQFKKKLGLKDGRDGTVGPRGPQGERGRDGLDGEEGLPGRDGVDTVKLTGYDLVAMLESMKAGDRLDAKAIKNLAEFIHEIATRVTGGMMGAHGGGYETPIKTSGGSPLRKDASGAFILPAGGGTLAIETPSGTINGVNNVFTVTHIPAYIILNGPAYFEGDGYTRVGLTITMAITPDIGSTIRSIYEV